MTIKAKKSKINLREKLAELLNFRQIRDRLDGLGLYLGKDRTGTAENLAVRGGANVDDLQLAEISAALGDTAVDVFVYDTRNDSDGGKWRERTSHTSWYNEELNTSTRGGRREFPAVAVIVAEANKVTIYDGDDPDLSMWMVFNRGSGTGIASNFSHIGPSNVSLSSIYAVNSQICIAGDFGSDMLLFQVKLINDHTIGWFTNSARLSSTDISKRNTGTSFINAINSVGVVSTAIKDVAMTVLPNALIDAETGLPVPTIAVATDGGVSVIKDDGSVVDITSSNGSSYNYSRFVSFDNKNKLLFGMDASTINTSRRVHWHDIPSLNKVIDVNGITDELYTTNATNSNVPDAIGEAQAFALDGAVASSSLGLTKVERNDNMFAFITSSYNTGWMPGDIKLATLSDNTVETVGVDETTSLIENATDWTGASGTLSSTLPTEWAMHSIYSSLVSVSGGELTLKEDNANNYGIILQTFAIEAEKTYTLKARFKANDGSARVWIGTSPTGGTDDIVDFFENTTSTYTEISHTFSRDSSVIGTGNVKVSIAAYGTDAEAVFDYVSITEAGELITNGTFDADTDWTKEAGWTISGGVASVNNTSGDFSSVQAFPAVEAGKHYVFTADVTAISAGSILLTYQSGSGYANIQAVSSIGNSRNSGTGPGPLVRYFRADTSGVALLAIAASNTTIASVDNASFREIEFDRSVNNRGLEIFGEIEKTPVAPGADLVAYSGFSADDYLMQPYNSDLDFGTGDFCIMCWGKKTTSSAYEEIFARSTPSTIDQSLILQWIPSGAIRFFTQNSGASYVDSAYDADDKGWHFITAIRRSGVLELYINAVLDIGFNQDDGIKDVGTGFISSIGYRVADSTHPATNSSIALFRISATAPTPEQIAKIYRDEKVLFQDGAQATLYGASDAVTALAYDDKTELLHVGTSDGRSDFSGLRRINNTTTAVTTSISASNNLIAEQ